MSRKSTTHRCSSSSIISARVIIAQFAVCGHRTWVRQILSAKISLSCSLPCSLFPPVSIQRLGRKFRVSFAVIQGQINSYPERPGIKTAFALEAINTLYYFDKRVLSKFRGVVGVAAHFQDDVIYAVLIFQYQPLHRQSIAATTLLYKDRIVDVNLRSFGYFFVLFN